ncbi:MAG: hypothetical protein RLZZ565_593 [Planctomycetota bacterium]
MTLAVMTNSIVFAAGSSRNASGCPPFTPPSERSQTHA